MKFIEPKLTKSERELITKQRKELFKKFRNTPEQGEMVEYLSKEFIVQPNVFWPWADSKPLVNNFEIKPDEAVLDIGTGTGVIAIFAAYKGAKKVIALDISPDAVRNAKENVKLHKFEEVIDVRLSDGLEAVKPGEKFDVVTMNPPFTEEKSADLVEGTAYDVNFKLHKDVFGGLNKILKKNGRVYLSQANFGGVMDMLKLAEKYGFKYKLIGQKEMPGSDPRIFYAFELTRK